MNPARFIKTTTVLLADLDPDKAEVSIKAAIIYYRQMYGEPKRVWVNPKDVPEDLNTIENYKIERRRGCVRGKVMVI